MFAEKKMKTGRNKAYGFLKEKNFLIQKFSDWFIELPYKENLYFLLLLIILLYSVKRFFSLLFLIRKEHSVFFPYNRLWNERKKEKCRLAFFRAVRNMIPKYIVLIIGDREFAGKDFISNILKIKGSPKQVVVISTNFSMTNYSKCIKFQIAPIWLLIFFEKEEVFWTRRETLCPIVLLNLSI